MKTTVQLLKILGSPLLNEFTCDKPVESKDLYSFAFKNNVEMLYFEKLGAPSNLEILNDVYTDIRGRQKETLKSIAKFSSVLESGNIAYGITKTIRPYRGTPNDIDALFLGPISEYEAAAEYLTTKGYKITAPNDMQYEFFDTNAGEDFNKDKSGGCFYIDFYRELAADHMPYMDSDKLCHEIIKHKLEDEDKIVNVFTKRAEIVILALHSVLMHRTIPLEVIYTYSFYLNEMSNEEINDLWAYTKDNQAEPALRCVLTVMNTLYEECFDEIPDKLALLISLSGISKIEEKEFKTENLMMPHTVTLSNFVISVFSKIRGKRSRRGFFKELAHMLNPVFAVEVIYHMLSKKRIKKHSDHV